MRRARSILLLAALALACGTAVVAPGAANADVPAGFRIFGDFNNDGLTDVAILNPVFTTPCTVTLELGTGSGTFGPPTVYPFTPPPDAQGQCPNIGTAVKVGNDRRPDLVVTWQATDVASLLVLRNGDFQPAGEFGGIIEPDFIRTGDLTGDGRQDLILGSNQVTSLATFVNHPNGTFTRGPATCSVDPRYALADFNGDGAKDILLSDICPPNPTVLTAEVLFADGQSPAVLATSTDDRAKLTVFPIDLNYDGITDAGVIEVENGVTTVRYFLNDGHGHFTPFTGNTGPANPFLADMNNDGIPDMVTLGEVGQTTTCTVTVRLGRRDGTFGQPAVHQYTTLEAQQPFCPTIGTAAKLGTDKRPDLVTAFPFGFQDMMVVHDFQATTIFPGIVQPDWIRSADLNGDGRADIIEGGSQEEEIGTFTDNADGTLTKGPIFTCAFQHGTGPQYVLADFNGDGGQDMFLSDICPSSESAPDQAVILFGNGQAPVTLASDPTGATVYTVFALDVNYDGIPDAGVISTQNGVVTSVRYFGNDGHGDFTPLP